MKNKILNILKAKKSISFIELADELKINNESLAKSLKEFEETNEVVLSINSIVYFVDEKQQLGTIRINSKKFGFIKPFVGEDDFFIPGIALNGCLSYDTVLFSIITEDDGRTRGNVIDVIKREIKFMVGTLEESRDKKFIDFVPSDKALINYRIVLVNKSKFKLKADLIVRVKVSNVKEGKLFVYIEEIIGDANKAVDRIISVAYENDCKPGFEQNVLQEADNVAKPINKDLPDIKKRLERNLYDKTIVTIDGDDSKDLDDAICVTKVNDNYLLTVAIADVSYYVRPRTELDNAALYKGNSVYLANKVLPMLPEVLSNGVCSLNPNEDKLCMVADILIDKTGTHLKTDVYESIMKSKGRLTYKKVNEFFETRKSEYPKEVQDMLDISFELHEILEKRKRQEGTIDFEIPEPKAILNDKFEVIDIIARERGESEKLIENFMVAANVAVAKVVLDLEKPFLYRNHGQPEEESIIEWISNLKMLGINTNINITNGITPKALSQGLKDIDAAVTDQTRKTVINITLLHHMQKAAYEPENIGHFGLAVPYYTHFTSPIRRYSDLMVHRYLKKFAIQKDNTNLEAVENFIERACKIINETEKKAINAEREVNKMCMAEYMQKYIGQEYEGIISAVLKFGIFVQLPNSVEGLIHISSMPGAVYDEKGGVMLTSDKKMWKLGEKIKIKVKDADVKKRMIDFTFANTK
ncbi:ribonuclease R [Spiroplasma sp. TIUS-1]|uniref:ribonuclease R n=1 Tax=Spiroplasma sp. TIUS-1 TaxID=216963 RepID=UPI001397D4BD|nr:ribonuclease R [Spiroplasma sp. TIUS-1]QHX35624.1 ribonuclease R [Spiroplasma sp. TIUS-1]